MTTTSSPSPLIYLVFSLTFLSVPCPPPPELSTHVFLFLFLFCCVVYLLHEPRGASPSSSSYFSIAHTLLPSVFTDSLTNQHSVTCYNSGPPQCERVAMVLVPRTSVSTNRQFCPAEGVDRPTRKVEVVAFIVDG